MDADEKASFAYGGQRASKRKGIERSLLNGVTYLKPPGSCRTKYPDLGINVEVECLEKSSVYVLDVCEQVQVSDLVLALLLVLPRHVLQVAVRLPLFGAPSSQPSLSRGRELGGHLTKRQGVLSLEWLVRIRLGVVYTGGVVVVLLRFFFWGGAK